MQNEAAIMPELPRVSLRILCVEDEPELLDDLATELLDHGFAVDKAVHLPVFGSG